MRGDYFYNRDEVKFFLSDYLLDKVRSLKGVITDDKNGYYDYVEWMHKKEDVEVENIWITMHFLTMTANPKQELIEKYDLNNKKYLLLLLRELYLELFDDVYLTTSKIVTGYSRPFGNGHILGDIRYAVEKSNGTLNNNDDDDDDENYVNEKIILKEFLNFLIDFFNDGFEVKFHSFYKKGKSTLYKDSYESHSENSDKWDKLGLEKQHSYLSSWTLGISELRDIKLNKLLI